MAYPASTKTLGVWVRDVDTRAYQIKEVAQQQHALSLASNLDMESVRRFFDNLVAVNVFFTQAAAVTGIGTYLNTEKQGIVANPVAEFTAMQAAIVAVLDWLRTNVPQGEFPVASGNNYKLGFSFPTGNVTASSNLKFTAAQTAGYRTVLTSLINVIS